MTALETVQLNIADLKPAKYNPRKMDDKQFNDLKQSLLEFGFVEPIIVNKDMTIIGGHQRIKVWSSLGNTNAPAVILNLSTGDFKHAIYWFSAASLTACVTI